MSLLTEHELDRLALEGCEMLGFKSGSTVAYDPAGYERSERIQVEPGSLATRDCEAQAVQERPAQAVFEARPYPSRIAGFQRRDIFGPDEIGGMASSRNIPWNDGLGNGLFESLRIDRKYGLKHVLEPPILGFSLPFLPSDRPAFQQNYQSQVDQFLADLREQELAYGGSLADKGERMAVLWCPHTPLSLFAEAYRNTPAAVEDDLEKEIGVRDIPAAPQTPAERATLARFWALIRRRQAEAIGLEASILRQRMGPGLVIAANNHELPPLDMELQGQVFDFPAVAIRPLLLDDEVMLRHYVAYFTRFFRDLAEKPPMISVRMNLSAASPRFVPSSNLIRRWYDQAVCQGAGAFYFWTRDYPYSDAAGIYDGPIPGNPDPCVHGEERFATVIDLLGKLANRQRFIPPAAEIAILVPNEAGLLDRTAWRRIYAIFSACAEARLHVRFISDRTIAAGGVPAGIRLMLAPVLEFLSSALRSKLEEFTRQGGSLFIRDMPLWDAAGHPAGRLAGAQQMHPAALDVFPAGEKGSQKKLESLADILAGLAARWGAASQSYVFDVGCDNLPLSQVSQLRPAEPGLRFSPWLYEHGSPWIVPYL